MDLGKKQKTKTNKIPDKVRGECMAMGELYWLFEQYKNLAFAFVFVKKKATK